MLKSLVGMIARRPEDVAKRICVQIPELISTPGLVQPQMLQETWGKVFRANGGGDILGASLLFGLVCIHFESQ